MHGNVSGTRNDFREAGGRHTCAMTGWACDLIVRGGEQLLETLWAFSDAAPEFGTFNMCQRLKPYSGGFIRFR